MVLACITLLLVAIQSQPLAFADSSSLSDLYVGTFVPCTLDTFTCSNRSSESANLTLARGNIAVTNDGHVAVALIGLKDKGAPAARRSFKLALGPSYPVAQLNVLGTITTETDGNFVGSPRTSAGAPFVFPRGTTVTGQFALLSQDELADFVTGISPRPGDRLILQQTPLVPCTPSICGTFQNNLASISVDSARVVVAADGSVAVQLKNVRDLGSGTLAIDRPFEVWIAQFGSAFGFAGPLGGLIGQIRTDASGGYSGPVVRFGGGSFTFGGVVATGEGPPFAIQFIINTPGVRSELVAGITINR